MRGVRLALFVGVILLAIAGRAFSADDGCLKFGRTYNDANPLSAIVADNLRTAFAQSGLCFSEKVLPAKRLTVALREGEIDGEFLRVSSYAKTIKGIAFPVDEPLFLGIGYLVIRDATAPKFSDISAKPLGTVRGYAWHERFEGAAAQVVQANSYEQLEQMYQNHRIDQILIDSSNLHRFSRFATEPRVEIARDTVHIFLHESRRTFAGKVKDAVMAFKHLGCRFDQLKGGAKCHAEGALPVN